LYDVIVVGAGPSGAILSYQLARSGAKVLVLEKERLPRYKTCGGGVTVRAAKVLPLDLSPVVERTVYHAQVSLRMGRSFERTSPDALVYMTMRNRLDTYLMEHSQRAGAELMQGVQVQKVSQRDGVVSVSTTTGDFEAAYVAGCDGANSVVAQGVGAPAAQWSDVALEVEWHGVTPATLDEWRNKAAVDVGVLPGGYAWIFPKGDHLSIGAAASARHSRKLRGYLDDFARYHGFALGGDAHVHGHKLPVRRPRALLHRGRTLLVGDAASLVEPFSGEGIYSAAKSAMLAAQALREGGRGRGDAGLRYQSLMEQELLPELNTGAFIAKLFPVAPKVYFSWLGRSDRLWSYARRVLRGESNYQALMRKLGPLGVTQHLTRRWNSLGW